MSDVLVYLECGGSPNRLSDVTARCWWGRGFQEGATGCAVEGMRGSIRSATPTNHIAGRVAGLEVHIALCFPQCFTLRTSLAQRRAQTSRPAPSIHLNEQKLQS